MKAGISLFVLLLAGCTTTAQQGITERFRCDAGTVLTVVFLEDHAMLRAGDEQPVRLDQQRTGSGFSYSSAARSIRGKGRALTYTMDGTARQECTAIDD